MSRGRQVVGTNERLKPAHAQPSARLVLFCGAGCGWGPLPGVSVAVGLPVAVSLLGC
jgi:hypothetical protein